MAERTFIICFAFLCGITGIRCCSPRQATVYEEEPHIRIDGGWGSWREWTTCTEKCIIQGKFFKGIQTRKRLCDNPPRLGDGKNCSGEAEEQRACKLDIPTCPPPVNGNWSPWGKWMICSRSCSLYGDHGVQYRSRACNNPSPMYGGQNCPGENYETRKCEDLAECDVDGGFSEWEEATPCEPITPQHRCTEGRQDLKRSCTNPAPSGKGINCQGRTLMVSECWYKTGCPDNMQSVKDVVYYRNKDTLELNWRRTPYGEQPLRFNISYWPSIRKEATKSFIVNVSNTTHAYGETYTAMIPDKLTRGLYIFSIESFNSKNRSVYSFGVRMGEVDGRWSEWGFWSNCLCDRRVKIRERKCDSPPPSTLGNNCIGESMTETPCHGLC